MNELSIEQVLKVFGNVITRFKYDTNEERSRVFCVQNYIIEL